jgi:hypothetical protein
MQNKIFSQVINIRGPNAVGDPLKYLAYIFPIPFEGAFGHFLIRVKGTGGMNGFCGYYEAELVYQIVDGFIARAGHTVRFDIKGQGGVELDRNEGHEEGNGAPKLFLISENNPSTTEFLVDIYTILD